MLSNSFSYETKLSALHSTNRRSSSSRFRNIQHLIGKLMYLAYAIESNILFVVSHLSRHNLYPQASHLYIAKQILKYLKSKITLGIVWENDLAGHG